MELKTKVVRDGWHSLRIVDANDKVVRAVGIMLEGIYPTGPHGVAETIQVIDGELLIDGTICDHNIDYKINEGQAVTFEARNGPVVYMRT